MAITNQERFGRTLEILRLDLAPYVEREFANADKENAQGEISRLLPPEDRIDAGRSISRWNAAALL